MREGERVNCFTRAWDLKGWRVSSDNPGPKENPTPATNERSECVKGSERVHPVIRPDAQSDDWANPTPATANIDCFQNIPVF